MNPRERIIETLTFGNPDKVPFDPGYPRESTLAAWREQGLPAEANWRTHLHEILGFQDEPTKSQVWFGVDLEMMPKFEEKILEHKGDHLIVQDWKGNICEISDKFTPRHLRNAPDFVTRRWLKCPVENRDDWEQMKTRYNVDEPGRPDDFAQRCEQLKERDYQYFFSLSGPFWQLREWVGFEGLCFMMIEQPDLVNEMAEFWKEFVAKMLDRICRHVAPDRVRFNEDMAYKAKAMISPAMMREFCKPSWVRWTTQLKQAGCRLVEVDSDGFIGEIIPIWIEAGINITDPVEVAAHNDINEFRRTFGHKMAYCGGIDKRAMAKGGQVLRAEMKRIEPVLRDSGYIPSCDHGIPPDISWPNMIDYSRQLAQMTGWL